MSWKDCLEWQKVGFPLSTTSNEAAKMYDAVVTQYMSGYTDESVGGIKTCMDKMLEADPNFVLGYAAKYGATVIGRDASIWNNRELKTNIENMVTLAENSKISTVEQLHVDAVKLWSIGKTNDACDKWQEILLNCPTDILAFRCAFMSHFLLGQSIQLRDVMAQVLPQWKSSMSPKMYSHARGLYAFGLVETHFYDEAEKEARKTLELNSRDAWAVHTVSHVKEMQCRPDDGIEFIDNKVDDIKGSPLQGHVYWHKALYYFEKGDYESTLSLYDEKLCHLIESDMLLNITDAAALFCRLELEGVNVGDRWHKVYDACIPHLETHSQAFNDIHFLMAAHGAQHSDVADKLIQSIKTLVSDSDRSNTHINVYKDVGMPMLQAFKAYNIGDYGTAVDLLYPVRYNIVGLGGSNAQRDVFNLFLIHTAMKSTEGRHKSIARSLLHGRKAQRESSTMVDRLLEHI
ncbi:tetratricopeptide repeat protein 38-like [Glandiceps talaboti]